MEFSDSIFSLSDSSFKTEIDSNKPYTTVKLSALASMKMLTHCLSGVNMGLSSKSGKPFEVMGILIGRVISNIIVIYDATPLPVQACETSVLGADDNFTNYLINLSESIERKEEAVNSTSENRLNLVGWYHSHPFEVSDMSHCFLSSTDCQTEALWQLQFGGKWVALVMDPLRCLAKGNIEIGAYRTYPANYSVTMNNTGNVVAPDNSIKTEDEVISRWGNSYNRFYCLAIDFFTSQLSSRMISIMNRKHLWIHSLSRESKDFSDRINNIVKQLTSASSSKITETGSSNLMVEMMADQCVELIKEKIFNSL